MIDWLKDAVFYEIYPQSFNDTNDDGIGDLNGIVEKLDYIKDLGCNALWLNPIFDSPFKDAGYDVRDYYKIADRYGTMSDFERMVEECHKRDIKLLLDLVPGHTSNENEWFKKSCEAEENEYSKRYIWTSQAFWGIKDHPYIAGEAPRDGAYMLNFFASQPALNYGWGICTDEWMSAIDSPEAIDTREAMKDVMRFWLDKGIDGFRVDMADSLVKNDDDHKHATAAIWRNIREMLDKEYPHAALVSEWSNPDSAINLGGFHMDFYLDHWHNGYNTLVRDYEPHPDNDQSFFKKDSGGDIKRFLNDYLPKYVSTKNNGYISMFTCNHDTPRPARTLDERELKLFYGFIFTMPGVPFLYYGDEIGMKYREGLVSVEGGYNRTGSRTIMQWNDDKNFGFSNSDTTYINCDYDDGKRVSKEMSDKDSLWNFTRDIIHLRHQYECLQSDCDLEVIDTDGQLFTYKRGDLIICINASGKDISVDYECKEMVYLLGSYENGVIGAQSFMIFKGE